MLRRFMLLAGAAAIATAVPATAQAQAPATTAAAADEPPPMQFPGWGLDVTDLDTSVDPGDDFDKFVNGKWQAATEIPAKYPYYGVITNLRIDSERNVKAIIDDLAARQNPPGSAEQKIADFYRAYLDVDSINAAGMAPVQPYLQRIRGIRSHDELGKLFAETGYPAPFGEGVSIDRGDPNRNTLYVGIGGLGLPDRDNYLVDNERNREMKAKYLDYAAFLLEKAGEPAPKAAANSVYNFERRMAEVMWDRGVARNPLLTTNRMGYDDLVKLSNGFPLADYLNARGILPTDTFNVLNVPPSSETLAAAGLTPEQAAKLGGGFPALMKLVMDTPLDVLKSWMIVRLISSNADLLPSEIDDANFAFNGKFLQGREKQRDRWQRAVSAVEGSLGESVGKIYVDRHFPPSSKAAMEELVGNLRLAMTENLRELEWMTPATRAAAKTKLDQLRVKIGYPSKFETYDTLVVSPTDPVANRIASAKWAWADELSDLRKPIDREEWLMTPQMVNAYYMSTANEMAYPAAYLQPPNFSPTADLAMNYGAIGATIGHEMGHGFDDQGSRYDGTGQLKNWWAPKDAAAFKKLGEKLGAQYAAICPLDDGKTCINPALTMGENIGDLGGLSMAYRAYKIALGGKEAPVIDGLTGDQRFFIAYALHQRTKYRDPFLRQLIQTDSHSPDFARVNVIVRNFTPWYTAFNVKPGDDLYLPPSERVIIW